MAIKTIHIKNFVPIINGNAVSPSDVPKLKILVRELYEYTLKDDPSFHFFFEPEIIFRITTEDCLTKTKSFLQNRNIEFEEYDYPFAQEGKFGEKRGGIVVNNLELFLPMLHAHSIAALTMNEEEHLEYLERVIHDAFNPKLYSYKQEGEKLAKLAVMKIGSVEGVIKLLKP